MPHKMTRYEEVSRRICHLIENGVFKEGDRLPSLRRMSEEMKVSINTVKEAYWRLEDQHQITAVPQSGYYVRKRPELTPAPPLVDPTTLDPQEITLCQIFGAFQDVGRSTPEIRLALGHLDAASWPAKTFGRYFHEAARNRPEEAFTYLFAPGSRSLREQIARQGVACGLDIGPDDVVITNGCQEALFLALMTLCEAGDTVVLESPIYFSLINLLQQLRLKIIEIPASDDEGVSLETLRFVLDNHPVKAMFSIPNFNNPMGFTMPSWKKRKLVRLLGRHSVPLIEDDIYGDLCFGPRPEPCKVYDTKGEVILCSSFSKTIAPGLRVGWMLPGKYTAQVNRLKTLINLANPPINQIAVTRFLKEGGYRQHIRRVRRELQVHMDALRASVLTHFPTGTRVTRPEGGLFVWVELPEAFDTDLLYRRAIRSGILFAPGNQFSIQNRYHHHLRLSTGTWNDRVEKAIARLGRLCARMGDDRTGDRDLRVAAG